METTNGRTPSACVIGAGRMGRALHAALQGAGIDVSAPWSRTSHATLERHVRDRSLVFVAVPDDAVLDVLDAIAAAADGDPVVVVTSGSVRLDGASDEHRGRIRIARMHPLRVIATLETATPLAGATCAIACADADGLERVGAIATALGMRPVQLADHDAPTWHAAAVLASNFVTALLADSAAILTALGVPPDDATAAVTELAGSAIGAVAAHGPVRALTGPIARGDEGTVAAHREALGRAAPELVDAYDALATRTRALATTQRAAAVR